MREYLIYPNGDYYDAENYDEHPSWHSDDYYVLEVPDEVEDDDQYIEEHINAVDLGESCEQKTLGPLA